MIENALHAETLQQAGGGEVFHATFHDSVNADALLRALLDRHVNRQQQAQPERAHQHVSLAAQNAADDETGQPQEPNSDVEMSEAWDEPAEEEAGETSAAWEEPVEEAM